MFTNADALREEYASREAHMADPATHSDMALSRRVGRRYSELTPIVRALAEHDTLTADLEAARARAAADPAFAEEAVDLEARLGESSTRLAEMLAPRDPHDSLDALLEIKSGEGGEESALFAGDLFRMYSKYAEQRGWKVEVLDSTETDLGGIKSLTMAVKGSASAGPDDSPYGVLKFEGGVHRVQRVPVTETQGRIHTSAAGVLVMPDVEDDADVEVSEDDLRVDVYRSSGKGGQGVNTTDSAVRLTHLPTGLVVTCQNERSQLQNKASALRILKARGNDPDNFPYGVLKFEGGVHRVQRVPVTETQGRVHTSAAGVLVMPDAEEAEVAIDPDDLRIDVYRSSGPGGQGVNTTDSAVRITHLPTGIVVSCQNERSQLQNKESAMRMLRARLVAAAEEQAAAEASAARRSQVRTVDRSERIRTYNFGENRIADHRIGYKAYNLDAVLAGDLGGVIQALQAADLAERLDQIG